MVLHRVRGQRVHQHVKSGAVQHQKRHNLRELLGRENDQNIGDRVRSDRRVAEALDLDPELLAERGAYALGAAVPIEIDGFRDTPVGPHPIANVLVIFKPDQFAQVVPYLMLNRAGLDILVHPLTTDAVADHSDYAIWLGNPVALKLHTLPRGRGGRLPSGVVA